MTKIKNFFKIFLKLTTSGVSIFITLTVGVDVSTRFSFGVFLMTSGFFFELGCLTGLTGSSTCFGGIKSGKSSEKKESESGCSGFKRSSKFIESFDSSEKVEHVSETAESTNILINNSTF